VGAREPFGALEKVADGVWAMVSTPLAGDRTTLSNGGIIAGRNAVLAIEGFQTTEGARWLAGRARELTGRWPTHVVLTHYHSDHANGVAGYHSPTDHPVVRSTDRTRTLVIERNKPADPARVAAVEAAMVIDTTGPSTIDLGGRVVHVVPRSGHTESDVSLELDDPSVVFCGDLLWNAMFPNFVDALPTALNASVRALRRERDTVYVPGHGALARVADYDRYTSMLNEVEHAARAAFSAGTPASEAANGFVLPPTLGAWALFTPGSKAFYQRAFEAWFRELKP
jgi:glyoxylase-like metal-dependent hydrolase (beta-lactamase superfamily II)